jgi:hypothetical protein
LQAAHVASLMLALQAIGRVQFHVTAKATP